MDEQGFCFGVVKICVWGDVSVGVQRCEVWIARFDGISCCRGELVYVV